MVTSILPSTDKAYADTGSAAGNNVGLFLDFDNLHHRYFDWHRQTDPTARLATAVPSIGAIIGLAERFGRLSFGTAYADWSKPELRPALMRLYRHGIEPVVIPGQDAPGQAPIKNVADVGLTVAVMDAFYRFAHLETFVLGSGDGDLLPLVTFLRRHGRRVVVLSVGNGLSKLLARAADVVIRYEDAIAPAATTTEFAPPAQPGSGVIPEDAVFAWAEAIVRECGGRCTVQSVGKALKDRHGVSSKEHFGCTLTELLRRAPASRLVVSLEDDVPSLALSDVQAEALQVAA